MRVNTQSVVAVRAAVARAAAVELVVVVVVSAAAVVVVIEVDIATLQLCSIQLFRERLSEKVHATILKVIVGGFEFPVLQRIGTKSHENVFPSAN